MNRLQILVLNVLVLCLGVEAPTQEALTYRDLIHRLYDLEYLATRPMVGEKSGRFSSYNRNPKYDGVSDTYVDWSPNGPNGETKRLLSRAMNTVANV